MVSIGTRKYYRRRMLESLGSQSLEEIGKLALDLMENTENLYQELGINDSGENDVFEYEAAVNETDKYRRMYDDMRDQYMQRFGGSLGEPQAQPPEDDITQAINPDTETMVTVKGNGGEDPNISYEDDIFDYREE